MLSLDTKASFSSVQRQMGRYVFGNVAPGYAKRRFRLTR